MNKKYETPDAEVIYFRPAEGIMVQDGNPSIGDEAEDWPEDSK